ncbi:hypothetical protein [Planococcus dechangensis]|uniref:Uncharacterized protein n=1 Tax=Planococcus dechangensis TaxID=1176255 RepID=A0ABV9MA80_9BACL
MGEVPKSTNNEKDQPPRTPRWLKVFGLIAIALILLVIAIMLFGGGNHGPGRHSSGDEATQQFVLNGQQSSVNQEKEITNDADGDYKPAESGLC